MATIDQRVQALEGTLAGWEGQAVNANQLNTIAIRVADIDNVANATLVPEMQRPSGVIQTAVDRVDAMDTNLSTNLLGLPQEVTGVVTE